MRALVSATFNPNLRTLALEGKVTLATATKLKGVFFDPYELYSKNLKNCLYNITLSFCNNFPIKRTVPKKELAKIWPRKPIELCEKLQGRMYGKHKTFKADPTKKQDDTTSVVSNCWNQIFKSKWIKRLTRYLVEMQKEEGWGINNYDRFNKFLEGQTIVQDLNAAKHYLVGATVVPDHALTVTLLHNKCTEYETWFTEIPRFISVLGYITGQDGWWKTEPNSIEDAWGKISEDEEPEEDFSFKEYTYSIQQQKLIDAREGGVWSDYIDKKNRVASLLTNISSSTITKVWGYGGVGKTALIYECLRVITNNEKYKAMFEDHIFWDFTLKSKSQGEFTQTGKVKDEIDYSVMQWRQSIESIITVLAKRSDDFELGRTPNELVKLAVKYLEDTNCFVVIDNAEDVETDEKNTTEKERNLLELFISEIVDTLPFGKSQSKIIITSRISKKYVGVKLVKHDYLNSGEMKELCQRRSDWILAHSRGSDVRRHLIADVQKEQWSGISNWIDTKLGSKPADAVGHPLFLIHAVWKYTTIKKKIEFSDLLRELIQNEDWMGDFQEYITSKSIDSLDVKYKTEAENLAAKFQFSFTVSDVQSIFGDESSGLAEGLIEHLVMNAMVNEIFTDVGKSNQYEWVQHIRERLAPQKSRTRNKPKSKNAVNKLEETISEVLNESKKPSKDDVSKVILQGERIKNIQVPKKEENKASVLRTARELKDLQFRISAEDYPSNEWAVLRQGVEEVQNAITPKALKILFQELKNSSEIPNDTPAEAIIYMLQDPKTIWEDVHLVDEALALINEKFSSVDKSHLDNALEDVLMTRWGLRNRDGNMKEMVSLAMKYWMKLQVKTRTILVSIIADEFGGEIDSDVRIFISEYLHQQIDARFKSLRHSMLNPKRTLNDLISIMDKRMINHEDDKQIRIDEIHKELMKQEENYCRSFSVLLPELKRKVGNKGTATHLTEDTEITVIVHSISRENDYNNKVYDLQHLYTKEVQKRGSNQPDLILIHTKFIGINNNLTKKLSSDEEEITVESMQGAWDSGRGDSKTDWKNNFIRSVDKFLTTEYKTVKSLGDEVDKECVKLYGKRSKEVRALGGLSKKLWKCLRIHYKEKISITEPLSSGDRLVRLNTK